MQFRISHISREEIGRNPGDWNFMFWSRVATWVFPLLCGSLLLAQTPDTAILQGIIVDPQGAAVAGAKVTVTNETTSLVRTSLSDLSGEFTVPGLPAEGAYTVAVETKGFAPLDRSQIKLMAGSRAELKFVLSVAGQTSSVTVVGSAGDVRIDQPQLGIYISRKQMQETPLLTRRITYLPLLDAANRPAINQGDVFMNENLFNTNGAGRRQTWFEVDGSNAVDMWGRQTIFTNIPLFAVGEMTVLTNAYSSVYGAGAGSVVNIVTDSGGNRLHGSLLELWRPAGTEAELSGFTAQSATNGNEITSDVVDQTAASLSGPIGSSGRTHFFASGEWNRETKASPITSPIAPGSFVGHYRGWLGLLRLDHQIDARNNAFLRANSDTLTDTNPNGTVGGNNLPSVNRIFYRRTYAIDFGETAALYTSLLNDIRAQLQLASPITEFDPVSYGTQFSVPITSLCGAVACGTFTSGTSQSALLMNRQYEATETLSSMRGPQQLILGGSVIVTHNGGNSKEFGGPIFLGKFIFNPCSQSPAYCESSAYLGDINNVAQYQQSYGNANYTVDDQLWSLFVQDSYRIGDRLSLSAGLRYLRQTLSDANKNFAPRAGFVWDVFGGGALVLRGGFGIYYSQIVDNSVASYALGEPSGVFTYIASPGQVGFPISIDSAPLPSLPAGAVVPIRSLYVRPGEPAHLDQYFPTALLKGYPARLLNPYSQQYTASAAARLGRQWVLSADYVGTHTLRVLRPLDVDSPAPFLRTAQGQLRTAGEANCSRPYWVWWYAQKGISCEMSPASSYPQPPYSVIQTDVNDGYMHYNALDVNLTHTFSGGFSVLASYTWSRTLDNVDPDTTNQNPNDPNYTQHQEYGPALYDQRYRAVVSTVWAAPFRVSVGGVVTLASGLPYNYVTGSVNSGDPGATTDRPVIDGHVIGRNAGRGGPIYSADPFVSRAFHMHHDAVQVDFRAEAFNAFNHRNFVAYSGTYGNGATAPAGLGAPLPGITSQLPARAIQFILQASF